MKQKKIEKTPSLQHKRIHLKANNMQIESGGETEKTYKPDIVMSIHGWLSDRVWQNNLTIELGKNDLKPAPYQFNFRVWPWVRNHRVRKFEQWYRSIVIEFQLDLKNHYQRPSIMAHSLGTWILAKSMRENPEIKFDKIFLLGSIVPSNFDWNKLIISDQVNDIVFEKTVGDRIVPFASIVTLKTQPSGKYGFMQESSFIKEVAAPPGCGHKSALYAAHYASLLKGHLIDHPPHPLVIVHGRSILDLEKAGVYLKQAIQIDNSVYDTQYKASPVSFDKLIEWFEVENDIWTFLRNTQTNEIDGYVNAIPVNEETYKKFISGRLSENKISQEEILNYKNCSEYYLLILSIALRKTDNEGFVLHKGKRAELLIMAMIDKINELRLKDTKLKKMGAVAWTKMGARLCKGLGMKPIRNDGKGHSIFEVDLEKIKEMKAEEMKEINQVCRWWYSKLKKE